MITDDDRRWTDSSLCCLIRRQPGCSTLFLNYLAYQLNFSWTDIVAAGAPTLGQTAAALGLQNAFSDFAVLLARHFPPGTPVDLPDDNPFPLPDPSLYIRHNLADDGTSHTGPLSESPDIIVKNDMVANPQATYSTPASIGSDTESDPAVLDGQPNYIYLRVWNRGTDAANVTATAYWSPPATLVTPGMWNLIGTAQFAARTHRPGRRRGRRQRRGKRSSHGTPAP